MADPKRTTRTWTIAENGTIVCYKSDINDCTVIDDKLATAAETTPAHDEDLARATEEINKILATVLTKKKSERHHLCFLTTHRGLFLAWTQEGVKSEDDERTVESALKLVSDY